MWPGGSKTWKRRGWKVGQSRGKACMADSGSVLMLLHAWLHTYLVWGSGWIPFVKTHFPFENERYKESCLKSQLLQEIYQSFLLDLVLRPLLCFLFQLLRIRLLLNVFSLIGSRGQCPSIWSIASDWKTYIAQLVLGVTGIPLLTKETGSEPGILVWAHPSTAKNRVLGTCVLHLYLYIHMFAASL